jgi:ribosomal-protein-alanine N-acetyltransferase
MDLSTVQPRPLSWQTTPIRPWELQVAVDIDRSAFPVPWQLDREGLVDAYRATARKRARFIEAEGMPVAYAVTGLTSTNGYLQRLAVSPDQQRSGFGRCLVRDSANWCRSKGATRLIVNTQVGNCPALALYGSEGFEPEAEGMVIVELPLTAPVTLGPGVSFA